MCPSSETEGSRRLPRYLTRRGTGPVLITPAGEFREIGVLPAVLPQVVTVRRRQRESVDSLEVRDLLESFGAERQLILEGVEDDSLQQVAQAQIFQLGQGFQNFQEALFHAHAGLDA